MTFVIVATSNDYCRNYYHFNEWDYDATAIDAAVPAHANVSANAHANANAHAHAHAKMLMLMLMLKRVRCDTEWYSHCCI